MNTIDTSSLTAVECNELIEKTNERLEHLRQAAKQQAELLGMVCTVPDGKAKKPRRNSAKHQPE